MATTKPREKPVVTSGTPPTPTLESTPGAKNKIVRRQWKGFCLEQLTLRLLLKTPYEQLTPKLKGYANLILAWNSNRMAGSAGSMSTGEQNLLWTWIESLRTTGGNQKYVVIVGPGTGAYAAKTQFKVVGFQAVGGQAATYHISIN